MSFSLTWPVIIAGSQLYGADRARVLSIFELFRCVVRRSLCIIKAILTLGPHPPRPARRDARVPSRRSRAGHNVSAGLRSSWSPGLEAPAGSPSRAPGAGERGSGCDWRRRRCANAFSGSRSRFSAGCYEIETSEFIVRQVRTLRAPAFDVPLTYIHRPCVCRSGKDWMKTIHGRTGAR